MNILICTQKVDAEDAVLGFMHRWIIEFASQYEKVIVIALSVGTYQLPENVTVLSLGKEEGVSRFTYVVRFFVYLFKLRRSYDVVFVHMNQIYVLLGFLPWRLLRKRIGLWYAHGHVPLSARIAGWLSDYVFTSTERGFPLALSNRRIVGQGIDLEQFAQRKSSPLGACARIVSIGRISPSKDYMTLLRALAYLREHTPSFLFHVDIVGGPITALDREYYTKLSAEVIARGLSEYVTFLGPVPNTRIVELLEKSTLFASMGLTGSLDKAMLEAYAVGVPVVTCNDAIVEVAYGFEEVLLYDRHDYETLAHRMVVIAGMTTEKRDHMVSSIRKRIRENHSIAHLVSSISNVYARV